jgi:hypothetical protein
MGLLDRFQKGSPERDAARTDREGEVRTRNVSLSEARRSPAVRAARERYGGLDIPATLVGMLTALAVLLLLGGLIGAAVGAIGYQAGLKGNVEEISLASLIGGLVTLFVAFVIGGWAAGRMARYDGGRNGLMSAVWAILLAAVLSALAAIFGADYDVLRRAGLPQPFSQDALTLAGIATALIAIGAMLLAGFLGGKWGERYHRRADATILTTREGGLAAR